MDLSRVAARDTLKPRREPYFQRIATGQFLGYRPSKQDGPGTWIARWYESNTRRQLYRSLGDFGLLPAHERYGAALKDARDWWQHLVTGGSSERWTVGQACEFYARDKPEAAQRFQRCVYSDPLAAIDLQRLGKRHVQEWRQRLEATPSKAGAPREPQTLNRDMVPLRAALNLALKRGHVLIDAAWRTPLEPAKAPVRRRDVYLDRQQRRDLLNAMPADLRAFATGLCVLPLRPGALAALNAADFDGRRNTLRIHTDKAGEGRTILLPEETAELLREQVRDKLPAAPLFSRADGRRWAKETWKAPFKRAAREAGLPTTVVAYTLRHCGITDLVTGGLDLFTVAQLAGTSVQMIEEHYGHLRREHAATALAGLRL